VKPLQKKPPQKKPPSHESTTEKTIGAQSSNLVQLSYGSPWAHYLGGYQDRLLGGPLGLVGFCHTTPDGVGCKDYGRGVLK
jgi:hypothetical protein